MIGSFLSPWLFHPLGNCVVGTPAERVRCLSLNFYSGIGSDLGELTLVGSCFAALGMMWHHLECHEDGCRRPGKYRLASGARACRRHHPLLDERDEAERGHVYDLHLKHAEHLRTIQVRAARTSRAEGGASAMF